MGTPAQDVQGYFVWQPPGKSITVHLRVDVVNRMGAEVMRGFGLVPKRGAEVGGVLIGTIEEGGAGAIVRVEDFELVECAYKRGPSFLLSDADSAAFEEACRRWAPETSLEKYAVGYFRSNTRDEFKLSEEDVYLMDVLFALPSQVVLLIKPYATKVSVASFFVREKGVFPENALLEFPFRRQELTGEAPRPRRPLTERSSKAPREQRPRRTPSPLSPTQEQLDFDSQLPPEESEPEYEDEESVDSQPQPRKRQVWLPLSFIFFVFGVFLGFLLAIQTMPRTSLRGAKENNYELSLGVSKPDTNLNVKWDRDAPAIRAALRGSIEIYDGSLPPRKLPLDSAGLQGGSLIYTPASDSVEFRLIVYPQGKAAISETVTWPSEPPAK